MAGPNRCRFGGSIALLISACWSECGNRIREIILIKGQLVLSEMRQRSRHRNKLTGGTFLAACVLLLANPVSAETQLTPHTAAYKIKISVLGGELTSHLDQTDDSYSVESVVRPTGLARLIAHGEIRERSTFSIVDSSVRPTRYSSKDSLSSDEKSVDFQFDWDAFKILGTVDDQDFEASIEGAVVDRVSLQYALMYDMLNDGIRPQYILQDGDTLKLLDTTITETKMVKVPFGRFEVIGIRHSAKNSTRETTLWCSPELGYLPVIIEQYRKGKLRGKVVLKDYVPTPLRETDEST